MQLFAIKQLFAANIFSLQILLHTILTIKGWILRSVKVTFVKTGSFTGFTNRWPIFGISGLLPNKEEIFLLPLFINFGVISTLIYQRLWKFFLN